MLKNHDTPCGSHTAIVAKLVFLILLLPTLFTCDSPVVDAVDNSYISVSTSTVSVAVDSSFTATATIIRKDGEVDTVSLSSSDESITTVSYTKVGDVYSITVAGVSAGSATITVTSGSGLSTTIAVTVSDPPPVGTASLTVVSTVVALETGDTTLVGVDAKKADGSVDTFSVVSSASAKATAVAEGAGVRISAVSAGSATVTVTSGSGLSVTISVTVSDPPILVRFYVEPRDFAVFEDRYKQNVCADVRRGSTPVTNATVFIDGIGVAYSRDQDDYAMYRDETRDYLAPDLDIPLSATVDGITFTGTAHTLPYPTFTFSWGSASFDRTVTNSITVDTGIAVDFGGLGISESFMTNGVAFGMEIDDSTNIWTLTIPAYSIKAEVQPEFVYKVYKCSDVTASVPARVDAESLVYSILQVWAPMNGSAPTGSGDVVVDFD